MQSASITVKNVRPQFYTKEGRPKKEHLVTVEEALKNAGVFLSKEKFEKYYQKNIAYSVLTAIKKDAHAHSEGFVVPKFKGVHARYGFTKNVDYHQNYMLRTEMRAQRAVAQSKEVKLITQQLSLLPA